MGRKKTKRRGRLGRIAAGLAAAAAAIIPGIAAASPIALQARLGRAETALRQGMARTDEATLRVFACDCAARVAPLYERFGGRADMLERARERALATVAMQRTEKERTVASSSAAAPRPATALEIALGRLEDDVHAFEQEVASEATVAGSARSAVARLIFARSEHRVARWGSDATEDTTETEPPFRMLAVAMTAAEAVDEALLVAAGGSLDRIGTMCEAIAEAIYLDHAFRTADRAGAIAAVFRELAWQRSHLHALRSIA